MPHFLVLQTTPDYLELGVFRDTESLIEKKLSKFEASKSCITYLDTALLQCHLDLKNIDAFMVNRGPGLFTTLRTLVSTINGLSFVTHIPSIGINGLEAVFSHYALLKQYVFLYDACGNDVYYAINLAHEHSIGCMSIMALISRLQRFISHENIPFLGNGSLRYKEIIRGGVPTAVFPTDVDMVVNLQTIALLGYTIWQSGNRGTTSLRPLYFKNHPIDTQPIDLS